ncbi:MAG: DUF438 domain-containing protein [Clostridiales bacterium]|jgi:DUF438 domain-containing protein|nr:DUF438 domain-containing protein [Clostridiales bacterium]
MSELINNREHRQKMLKEMITDLHSGQSVESVKERFKELLEHVGATEISAMEQMLIEEGMPAEEIKRLCDVHTAVFKDSLDVQEQAEVLQGHPIHTFKEENKALSKVIANIEAIVSEISTATTGADVAPLLQKWRDHHESLLTLEKHFSRKENIIFPYLEKNGITGPPKVMWSLHDEIRRDLKNITSLLQDSDTLADKRLTREITDHVIPTLNTIKELFYKEENILFPMCLETLAPDEWEEVYSQSDDIGYSLITPKPWTADAKGKSADVTQALGFIKLDTGFFTTEQLNSMLKTLPFDITFVDKDDIVRYFSAGKERIFPRTPAIIGRNVENCHPPDSVHVVERIVDDFKNNRREHADFWIQMQGMFVYIRYFPVRNENGEYLGVLEVTQNIKHIRTLDGEKRILDEQ